MSFADERAESVNFVSLGEITFALRTKEVTILRESKPRNTLYMCVHIQIHIYIYSHFGIDFYEEEKLNIVGMSGVGERSRLSRVFPVSDVSSEGTCDLPLLLFLST